MPISEDEYDPRNLHHRHHHHHHDVHSSYESNNNQYHAMSKAEQRRSNKPIMEKRRRARINHCLNELKTLILDAMKKDPARHSKLEKADILEMTVKHLQTIQRQQLSTAMSTDPAVIHKFKNGFNECASEVSRYINHMEGIETGVKQRLVSHLASCVNGLQQISPTFSSSYQGNLNNNSNPLFVNNSGVNMTPQNLQMQPSPEDINNNNASNRLQNMMTSLQLIPSRLPSGELALLLPNSQQLPGNVLPFFPSQSSVGNTSSATLQPSIQQLQQEQTKNPHTLLSPLQTEPNSTITSSTIDRPTSQHHVSAFTAVCRPTSSLKDNQRNVSVIKSPLPSPASSITSTTSSIQYEDTTPPKTNSSTTSDTSPNTSEMLLLSMVSENQKAKFSTIKSSSLPVLAVKPLPLLKENNINIKSDNDLKNNNLIKYYNNNLIKTYSNNNENNNIDDNNPTMLLQQVQKQNLSHQHPQIPIQIPLTVITNDNVNNRLLNSTAISNDVRYQHPALDYSIKKDHSNENNDVHAKAIPSLKRRHDTHRDENNEINTLHSAVTTMTSPLSFSPKVMKLSTDSDNSDHYYYHQNQADDNEDAKQNENLSSTIASTSSETTKSNKSLVSTTATEVTSQMSNCNNSSSGDMWRPW